MKVEADDRLLLLPKKLLGISRLSFRWSALLLPVLDRADNVVLRDL